MYIGCILRQRQSFLMTSKWHIFSTVFGGGGGGGSTNHRDKCCKVNVPSHEGALDKFIFLFPCACGWDTIPSWFPIFSSAQFLLTAPEWREDLLQYRIYPWSTVTGQGLNLDYSILIPACRALDRPHISLNKCLSIMNYLLKIYQNILFLVVLLMLYQFLEMSFIVVYINLYWHLSIKFNPQLLHYPTLQALWPVSLHFGYHACQPRWSSY